MCFRFHARTTHPCTSPLKVEQPKTEKKNVCECFRWWRGQTGFTRQYGFIWKGEKGLKCYERQGAVSELSYVEVELIQKVITQMQWQWQLRGGKVCHLRSQNFFAKITIKMQKTQKEIRVAWPRKKVLLVFIHPSKLHRPSLLKDNVLCVWSNAYVFNKYDWFNSACLKLD